MRLDQERCKCGAPLFGGRATFDRTLVALWRKAGLCAVCMTIQRNPAASAAASRRPAKMRDRRMRRAKERDRRARRGEE